MFFFRESSGEESETTGGQAQYEEVAYMKKHLRLGAYHRIPSAEGTCSPLKFSISNPKNISWIPFPLHREEGRQWKSQFEWNLFLCIIIY